MPLSAPGELITNFMKVNHLGLMFRIVLHTFEIMKSIKKDIQLEYASFTSAEKVNTTFPLVYIDAIR